MILLEPYKKLWSEIKKQTKSINKSKSVKYKNDFMKNRLGSYDNLPYFATKYYASLF